MKYKITFVSLLLSFTAFSQKPFDQYSFEAEYGFNVGSKPTIMDFAHWGVGFRYMMDETWGIKFDFAKDEFTESGTPRLASHYTRFTIQAVNNLGRMLNSMTMNGEKLGVLAHGGIGYSSLTSDSNPGTDNLFHLMAGLTPQYKISKRFAVYVDASLIYNFTQHFKYDGTYPNGDGPKKAFSSVMINASVGLTYYFGESGSRSDWVQYDD